MVTEKEYLQALKTIDNYHKQNDNYTTEIEIKKKDERITIDHFLLGLYDFNSPYKRRIESVLKAMKEDVIYLDAVTPDRFFRVHQAGKKTYDNFRKKQISVLKSEKLNPIVNE